MTHRQAIRSILPVIGAVVASVLASGLAPGLAAPALAAVLVDARGASVQGPEAARPGHAPAGAPARRGERTVMVDAPGGGTNLRTTATALWVDGVERPR
ncbi:hypothetical protein ACFOD9_02215 [Novosphingobium bradum]|uniref:Uncharacterized protein n=1 Tax=Novosphingobium bradum TaxID=1737444 RepID=A0ABV7IKE7_9SPHN